MKKIASVFLVISICFASVAAYNPPAGGEDFNLLSSPMNLSGANSVTGGALFNAGADSLIVNPALTANEQRVNLNAGYTFLYSTNKNNNKNIASAFQTGILIPFKMFIFSGYVNGTFIPFEEMNLESSINFKAGLSKEITENLYVGASASGGYAWQNGNDWSLCFNAGFFYNFRDLGFIKDFRIGASILNLGKTYSISRAGSSKNYVSSAYPTILTAKAGLAGLLFKNDTIKFGLAFDFTSPCFQNLIIDGNAQLSIKDSFVISVGEKFNLMETINGSSNLIPAVTFLFKFSFKVKNNEYLESNGWSQSEMSVSAGYKNLYGSVHAASAGIDLDLGMADDQPPKIVIWNNE